MAPRVKDGDPTVVADSGSNVTQATFMYSVHAIARLEKAKDKAVAELRQGYKQAQDAGIDLKVFKEVVREAKEDSEALKLHFRTKDRYMRFMGVETGFQFGLFENPEEADQNAMDKGRRAGGLGIDSSENPYQPSTDEGQKWMQGWHAGQKDIAEGMREQKDRDKTAKRQKAAAKKPAAKKAAKKTASKSGDINPPTHASKDDGAALQ